MLHMWMRALGCSHMALERTTQKVKNGRKKPGILQGIFGNA